MGLAACAGGFSQEPPVVVVQDLSCTWMPRLGHWYGATQDACFAFQGGPGRTVAIQIRPHGDGLLLAGSVELWYAVSGRQMVRLGQAPYRGRGLMSLLEATLPPADGGHYFVLVRTHQTMDYEVGVRTR